MLETSTIGEILKHDQLKLEQSYSGGAFGDFVEAPISFMPSYKYDPGTNNYDSSEKRRTPSYCDRILFRKGDIITPLKYDCAMNVMSSDHKPVVSDLKYYIFIEQLMHVVCRI
jgi:inositol polyphosphate 5-phosphatase INPP5B/F